MVYIRIRLLGILFTVLFIHYLSNAQTTDARLFLQNLHSIADESKIISEKKCVFIIANEKNCYKCFNDACNYLRQSRYKRYKIYFVIVMKKDYSLLLPMVGFYKNAAHDASETLIHFINQDYTKELGRIYNEPTPQMIIKKRSNIQYISYGKFLSLTHLNR